MKVLWLYALAVLLKNHGVFMIGKDVKTAIMLEDNTKRFGWRCRLAHRRKSH
jgi:hypothetical protein